MTDQAQVAVRLGEGLAQGGGRRATVAHLLAGLAAEPEGVAGLRLRRRFGEVGPRIALHDAVAAGALAPLDAAYVALPVLDRPAWTLELLAAARRVGGEDLAHLLGTCGVDLAAAADDLLPRMPAPAEVDELVEGPETHGRMSLLPAFTPAADLAVARTRAVGGGSRELLAWLGATDDTALALRTAPAVPLDRVVARAAATSPGHAGAVGPAELVTAITHLSLQAALEGR